jgi:hypothetical protein
VAKKKTCNTATNQGSSARCGGAYIYIYKSRHDLTTESAETGVVCCCYLGEGREVDGQQAVGGLLPLVRREDDGAVGFKRDWRFAGVDHLQLRADGVKHDLQDKEPATSYIRE